MNNTKEIELNFKFTESKRALEALEQWKDCLTQQQLDRLLGSSVLYFQSEFQIYSGPDLMQDRAGFGDTIENAVYDYVSIYVNKKLH